MTDFDFSGLKADLQGAFVDWLFRRDDQIRAKERSRVLQLQKEHAPEIYSTGAYCSKCEVVFPCPAIAVLEDRIEDTEFECKNCGSKRRLLRAPSTADNMLWECVRCGKKYEEEADTDADIDIREVESLLDMLFGSREGEREPQDILLGEVLIKALDLHEDE